MSGWQFFGLAVMLFCISADITANRKVLKEIRDALHRLERQYQRDRIIQPTPVKVVDPNEDFLTERERLAPHLGSMFDND